MTDEEINVLWSKLSADNGYQGKIIPFARLIAARQREKDTEICESFIHTYVKDGERWMRGDNGKPDFKIKDVAPHLEAAYEMEQILKHGSVIETITVAHKIAAAIRTQGRNDGHR